MKPILQSLQEQFGYDHFREGQQEIIQSILTGKDVLAILPTGSGKTLCYHLPAILLDGLTIVISPLVSLMEDQVTQMKAKGDKAVAHISSLISPDERKDILRNIEKYHLIFLSPEMVSIPYIKRVLARQNIRLFVVDEAHCISQWGHEFRTDYLRLSHVRKQLGNPPCLALTATATSEVEQDIRKQLEMKNESVYRYPVNRTNIYMAVETVKDQKEKDELFLSEMKTLNYPVIVYTGTRKRAVSYATLLQKKGFLHVAFYHGGMSKEDRLLVQQQFIHDEIDIICCTNAFGMGINKSNVRSVVHLNLPSSVEQYVQEIGRAGRDNKQSLALLINSEEDRFLPMSFIDNEFPNDYWLDKILIETSTDGRPVEEVRHLVQMDEIQWKMLIFYLEKENVVQSETFVFNDRGEKVLSKIKAHFDMRRKEKKVQLMEMNTLLKSQKCIRHSIGGYFSDDVDRYPETQWCCSSCQPLSDYLSGISHSNDGEKIKNNHRRKAQNEYWKDTLKKMLFIRDGDMDSE